MRFSTKNIHDFYKPSVCTARVYLVHQGIPKTESGAFDEVIKMLGERKEKAYLQKFPEAIDLADNSIEDRLLATRAQIEAKAPCLYQPFLAYSDSFPMGDRLVDIEFTGIPDFILFENGGYIIRDVKLASRITEKDHPEIILQLQYYGWLFEKQYGIRPVKLEVFSGANELVEIHALAEEQLFVELGTILHYQLMESQPYSPVGSSKCGDCGYNERCWEEAKDNNDPAILVGVDQGLALSLKNMELDVAGLLKAFNEQTLSEFKRESGGKAKKVGIAAKKILLAAQAHLSGNDIWFDSPDLPQADNYVMFDLEGLPPYIDGVDKVYLWGMQVYGTRSTDYIYSLSDKGDDGDHQGWLEFLRLANEIMQAYPGIKFIHYADYERAKIQLYIKRFGDPDGIAEKVAQSLFDISNTAKKSVIFPLPNYKLKVVEKYVGFKRTQTEYGGDWSIAKYIEAVEMANENEKMACLKDVLIYNQEDLAATWAVFDWLRAGPSREATVRLPA